MDVQASFEPHFFPLIRLEANPRYIGSDTPSEVSINSKLTVNLIPNSTTRFFCEQRVDVARKTSPDSPYYIDIACMVFITIGEEVLEEERQPAVARLAHMLLFPAIRELVLNLTARQPWGAFSIGISNLQEESPAKRKNKSVKKPRKPSKQSVAPSGK